MARLLSTREIDALLEVEDGVSTDEYRDEIALH
jgi:flagellar motor switch protein FliM